MAPFIQTVFVLGCLGKRATAYISKFPPELQLVGGADVDAAGLAAFAERHGLDRSMCFEGLDECLGPNAPVLADIVMNCMQDHMHAGPTVRCAEIGYRRCVLEKPVGVSEAEVRQVWAALEDHKMATTLCYVMLAHPLFKRARELVRAAGRMNLVIWKQPVRREHWLRVYGRGPWARSGTCGNLLNTKACHDLEELIFILDAVDVAVVSCHGARVENVAAYKPAAARGATRCSQCPAESTCAKSVLRDIEDDPRLRKALCGRGQAPTVANARARLPGNPQYDTCVYTHGDTNESYTVVLQVTQRSGHVVPVTMVVAGFDDEICHASAEFIGNDGIMRLVSATDTLEFQAHSVGDTKGATTREHVPAEHPDGMHRGADYEFVQDLATALPPTREDMRLQFLACMVALEAEKMAEAAPVPVNVAF